MRPSLFIGSSSEGIEIARGLQVELDRDAEVEIWSQGVFGLSTGTLASLVSAVDRFDFAVLVLTADDLVITQGDERNAPRDNVVFELGLFMGALGVERTFLLCDRSNPPSLPSDLAGVTTADYEPHSSGNVQAAVGAAAYKIRHRITQKGFRPIRASRLVAQAATSIDEARSTMAEITRAMARSREAELEITLSLFSPMLDPAQVARLEADRDELKRLASSTDDSAPSE